jgi:hypothetical protein
MMFQWHWVAIKLIVAMRKEVMNEKATSLHSHMAGRALSYDLELQHYLNSDSHCKIS